MCGRGHDDSLENIAAEMQEGNIPKVSDLTCIYMHHHILYTYA